MRKSFVALFLSFAFVSKAFSQTFEGTIEYTYSFESTSSQVGTGQLELMMGTRQTYHIKDGYYKSTTNGQAFTMQVYDWKTNRIYNKMQDFDTLYWFDASIVTDPMLNFEIKENAGSVMGIACDALIITSQTGTMTLYYNKAYKLKVGKFAAHKYNNWAFFIEKTGSVPLRTVIETETFKIISTATLITPIKLKDEFFALDPHAIIKKMDD